LKKQSTVGLSRSLAFKDTYKDKVLDLKEIQSQSKEDSDLSHRLSKKEASLEDIQSISDGLGTFKKFFYSVTNWLANTKISTTQSKLDMETNFIKYLQIIDPNIDFQEKLFMDDDTCDHNNKLRWSLYAIALGMVGLSKTTKIDLIGDDLIDASSDAREEENYFYE